MTSIWDYSESVPPMQSDIVGYDVEATDGSIGKIDESSDRAGDAYLVVDTGFWIFGKKRMVPAGVVEQVDDEERKVFVRMSKDDIKSAPDLDDAPRDGRDRYETYYGPFGR